MNMYTKLSMHLSRHLYKRGKFKGDAPADSRRRGMSHFRVVKGNDDTYRVRMYGTDIITAYPNGNVKLDTSGYYAHNTTIIRLNEALHWFFEGVSSSLYKRVVFSYSQPVLRAHDKLYSYYDGITLDAQGKIITPLQAFEQKRTDRAATKELAEDLINSGFTDAFKLLYATATPEDIEEDNYALFGVNWSDMLANNDQAHHWKTIIARNKYERNYWGGAIRWQERSNAKACWATIMAYCKKNMFIVSRSETYVL